MKEVIAPAGGDYGSAFAKALNERFYFGVYNSDGPDMVEVSPEFYDSWCKEFQAWSDQTRKKSMFNTLRFSLWRHNRRKRRKAKAHLFHVAKNYSPSYL